MKNDLLTVIVFLAKDNSSVTSRSKFSRLLHKIFKNKLKNSVVTKLKQLLFNNKP